MTHATAPLLLLFSVVLQTPGADTRRDRLAENPDSPGICDTQLEILRTVVAAQEPPEEQVAELERTGAVHDRLKGRKGVPAAVVERCRKGLHDGGRELTLRLHKVAQKTKDRPLYVVVDRAYREYLRHFVATPAGYEMSFYHAEVLWVLERWAEAHEAYTRVAKRDRAGKYHQDAAYAAVLALKNATKKAGGDKKPAALPGSADRDGGDPNQPPYRPVPFTSDEKRMFEALELSARAGGKNAPKVLYQLARMHYEHNQFEAAIPAFRDVYQRYPAEEISTYAFNLHLDCLNVLGKKREVCATAARALEERKPFVVKDPEMVRLMRKLGEECARACGSDAGCR
jgi:TolA-binding protein